MTPSSDPAALIGVLFAVSALFAVVGIAVYVWTALALSRVFPRLGGESWKAWVPVLNTAEILSLGGVPAWSVVFLFIPLVNLYGLYLYIVGVHRINVQFNRGAGSTILAVLVQPVWASLLAWGSVQSDPERGRLVAAGEASNGQHPGTHQTTGLTATEPPRDASGYAIPPQPVAAPPAALPAQPASLPAPPASLPAPPAADHIVPGPDIVPVRIGAVPWSPPPLLAPRPTDPLLDDVDRDPVAQDPSTFDTIITRAPAVDFDDSDDDVEATVVVDRRPRVRWSLVLEDGATFDLTATSVVLGRNPTAANPAEQRLAVPDVTRTLSKTHARLELVDGIWTVQDLGSTNGVLVVDESGQDVLIEPWTSVETGESFILGVVGMRLVSSEGRTA